jgi:hypothetical protein
MTDQTQKEKCVYLIQGCRSKARYLLETGEPLCEEHFHKWLEAYGDEVEVEHRDDGLAHVVT